MIELTILMPCLNEAETLASCIEKAKGFLARTGIRGEVLISDNGSTDGSREIAERHGARVVLAPRRGNGIALSTGIAAARGRFVIMGDSDDSYDFSRLDAFVEALRGGADLVMGNRFRGGIEPGAMPFLHRYLGNPVLSFTGRVLYGAPVGDFQCGLRGFVRDRILGLNLITEQLEFCPEMVMRAALAGLKIVEVPTTLKPDGRSRKPHLRTWHDGWRHLKLLLTFAPFSMFLYPGLVLLALGGLLFLPLLFGPVALGRITLDTGAMIFAATFIITGFQLIWFHALARLFAVRMNLLPTSARFEALRARLSVEIACQVGAIFLFMAVIATASSVGFWAWIGFGPMDPSAMTRVASLVAVLGALGMQSVTNGFLWGLLSQRAPAETPAAYTDGLAAAPTHNS
ncbi:glycosyltransferase family 2 protein [Tabrizicola sp.]|jgi:glycosyltransferase involved in cell wall biosynthesis|uniref:glycosyltransferase family 2 protein n=1 Tax=Tabrizicola sp. TaxID=2005166 RepID=UPI0025E46E0A|nr:glycosyltransferase family 2 protein [Tabrizicola sp.]MBY0349839.1 glycosyltransferase family 2 protein [Tabrizicola sp.]